jgi:hypothetical protein
MNSHLPDPRLTLIYRLKATLGEPLELGEIAQGHRRIVPLTGGTFTGPELNGRLLARGEDVEASEYTFRTSTQIETAAPELDWLNKGVFIGVAGRQPAGVIYDTYLVG